VPEIYAHSSDTRRTSIGDLVEFTELGSPDWGLDFAPLLADLFSRDGVDPLRIPGGDLAADGLFVYRNAELKTLMVHPDLGNQPPDMVARHVREVGQDGDPGLQQLMTFSPFTMHPPSHNPQRQLFARQVTTKPLAEYGGAIRQLTEQLIDESADKPEIDFKQDFTRLIMVGFWSLLLGISHAESDHACRLASRSQQSNLFHPTVAQKQDINAASSQLLEFISSVVARQIGKADRPIFAALVRDTEQMDEAYRPSSLASLFGVSLLDGLHSLASEIASIVHALLSSERHLAAVRENRNLVTSAFHEGVRLHPAVSVTSRQALRDFEYQGLVVPAGTAVTMAWLFGNRDPAAFERPGEYEFERSNRRQTTFGGGFYICPGRNVVKLLGEIVLAALTEPSVEIVPTGTARWIAGSALHELATMPVAIRRR
jgi:cytochrome P450